MENQNEIKISIPKPCHEDWNAMTPNEKGAFCGKCAKTVVDFTKKTADEIKDFLVEQSGKKICGRFMSNQLDDAERKIDLYIPLNLLPKKLSFHRSFAFALFIVFGTTLFICSTQKGEVVGKIEPIIDTTTIIQKGEIEETRLTGDTVYNVTGAQQTITGSKKIETECVPLKGDVAIELKIGEIAAPIDTLKGKNDTLIRGEIKTGKIKTN
jgi:hypothetical protein